MQNRPGFRKVKSGHSMGHNAQSGSLEGCILPCGAHVEKMDRVRLSISHAALPGGLVQGSGDLRYGQTMAFTTLMFFQIFNVFNARSDRQSAFHHLFRNPWLWSALGLFVLLQLAVIYTPFLQKAFSTASLNLNDWLRCVAVASSVLWLREISKLIARVKNRR